MTLAAPAEIVEAADFVSRLSRPTGAPLSGWDRKTRPRNAPRTLRRSEAPLLGSQAAFSGACWASSPGSVRGTAPVAALPVATTMILVGLLQATGSDAR